MTKIIWLLAITILLASAPPVMALTSGKTYAPITKSTPGANEFSKQLQPVNDWLNQGDTPDFLIPTFQESGGEITTEQFEETKQKANEGDVEAQFQLYLWYNNGIAVSKNERLGKEWLNKAADGGHADALNELGALYSSGEGVFQNIKKAAGYFEKAAEKGLSLAQANLGLMHYKGGIDFPRNLEKARAYFQEAVKAKEPTAFSGMGWIALEEGNKESAIEWFKQSQATNEPWGVFGLGLLYLTDKSLGISSEAAFELLEQVAESHPRAKYFMGIYHFYGFGTAAEEIPLTNNGWLKRIEATPETARSEGLTLITHAAADGDMEAAQALGVLYLTGAGVDVDLKLALRWIGKAAKAHQPAAQYLLALLYQEGYGTDRNPAMAATWSKRAAMNDFVPAQLLLSSFYTRGFGFGQSDAKAKYWLTKAAESGLAKAQWVLSSYYRNGTIFKKDPKKMMLWLKKAEAQGYRDARFDMAISYLIGDGGNSRYS